MLDIRKVKSNLNSNIVLAIGINLIFIILALAFCDIKYEVSDDFIMATIMSGAYGYEPNPQMIFMNTILGYLMIPFYKLFPAVSWYFVFQMLLCFVTFVLVVYMLLEKLDRFTAILLSVMLLTFFQMISIYCRNLQKRQPWQLWEAELFSLDYFQRKKSTASNYIRMCLSAGSHGQKIGNLSCRALYPSFIDI